MNSFIDQWDKDPTASFDQFLKSVDFVKTSSRAVDLTRLKPLSKSSVDIYKLMFGKFARWLASRGVVFSKATHYDLLMFIELGSVVGNQRVADLNSKISYRYLRLIERCYLHLNIVPNPAQHIIFGAFKQERYYADKPMVALTEQQLIQFVGALPCSPAKDAWRQRRDRALQVMMLYAGLRVSEVIGLLLPEIGRQTELDGTLKVTLTTQQKSATSYEHSTFLAKDAVPLVLDWIEERQALALSGEFVFPTDNGNRQHHVTVYRQIKSTLVAAGIELPRSGGRTLRNTFAIQQIRNGTKLPDLTQLLGLALERSTDTYVRAEKETK